MNNYIIMTDSCCDLPADLAAKVNLEVIPLSVMQADREFFHYLDEREMRVADFYVSLREGNLAKTSAVNVNTFLEAMEPLLEKGLDILYLAFSSGLSSTYEAGVLAASELSEKYPERKIFVVDTLAASLGQGLIVYLTALEKEKGATIEEARDFCEQNKLHLAHWFTVDDLHHLRRGGRVSKTSATLGTVLNIKPVLHVDNDGHLINVAKVRGRQASLNGLVDRMTKSAIEPENQIVFISHGDCPEDVQKVADLIEKRFSPKQIVTNPIGPVIGTHSGPGTVALFFLATER